MRLVVPFCAGLLVCVAVASAMPPPDLEPIVAADGYQHDRWGTEPRDIVREFRAYTTSFDGEDDDADADDDEDKWGIPEWVAYELREFEGDLGKGPKRPSDWITEDALHDEGIAPDDDTYHFSNVWRNDNPDSPMIGYDRGHMCMKQHAFRLGEDADWNTHTVLNACPQRSDLNQGIWLDLENRCAAWADKYGAVWIICGPIVYGGDARRWLGQDGEVPAAIPDAFFKIVVKENDESPVPDVLAFIYPQEGIGYRKSGSDHDHTPYLASVDEIEALTGLNFLTALPFADERDLERVVHTELWDE